MNRSIDDLVANPHHHFNDPHEVLRESDLSLEDKRRILESWKFDAQRLAESTAENMTGGEQSDLREISKTLVELKTLEETPVIVTRRARGGGIRSALFLGALLGAAAGLVIAAMVGVPPAGWSASIGLVAFSGLVGALFGGVAAVIRNAVRA